MSIEKTEYVKKEVGLLRNNWLKIYFGLETIRLTKFTIFYFCVHEA